LPRSGRAESPPREFLAIHAAKKSPRKKRALNRNYRGARIVVFLNAGSMKTPVVALLTNDASLEECVAQVLSETGGLSHLPQSASDLLDLVCTIGQELDLALIDCEHCPHGLTLAGAINSRRENFPVIVITGRSETLIEALAYANGAAVCLPKPLRPADLAQAIRQCLRLQPQQPGVLA